MDENSTKIYKINNLYADIIQQVVNESLLKGWDRELSINANIKRLNIYDNRLIIPSIYGKLSRFQYAAKKILEDIRVFWKEHRNEYLRSVRNHRGLIVHSIGEDTTSLATYFDTVLITDELPWMSEDFHRDVNFVTINSAISILRMFDMIPLLRACDEFPYLAILPRFHESDDYRESLGDDVPRYPYDIGDQASYYMKEIMHSVSRYDLELMTLTDKMRLNTMFDMHKFLDVLYLDPSNIPDIQNMHDVMSLLHNIDTVVNKDTFDFLIKCLYNQLFHRVKSDRICHIFNVEPQIKNEQLYKSQITLDCKPLMDSLNLSEEIVAARALSVPPMKWIGNMTPEELVSFRDNDGMLEIRSVFAQERKRLKYAKLNEFNECINIANNSLAEVISEHNNRIVREERIFANRLRRTTIGFVGTVLLSAISIAAPPVANISIPLALLSVLIGGPSAIEVINEYISGKRKDMILRQRPIGIVAKYYNKSS